MGWGWWLHPCAEASSAAPPRGAPRAARDGGLSAKRCCGQPRSPRVGIRPRIEREGRTHVGSSGRRGKQREAGGKLAGSSPSPWPAQRQLPPRPCLLLAVCMAHHACVGCGAPAEDPYLLPRMGKEGPPGVWIQDYHKTRAGHWHPRWVAGHGSAAEGVSGEALHPQDAPSTWHGEQPAARRRKASSAR